MPKALFLVCQWHVFTCARKHIKQLVAGASNVNSAALPFAIQTTDTKLQTELQKAQIHIRNLEHVRQHLHISALYCTLFQCTKYHVIKTTMYTTRTHSGSTNLLPSCWSCMPDVSSQWMQWTELIYSYVLNCNQHFVRNDELHCKVGMS